MLAEEVINETQGWVMIIELAIITVLLLVPFARNR
jgi:hypothetical protein